MNAHRNVPDLARTLLDTCLCHNVRMASRVVSRAYDEALRPSGLRATQIAVLAAVGARGALSIKSLADSLEMERTTLTRNLRPLEEQGLVAIAPEGRPSESSAALGKSAAILHAAARRSALARGAESLRRPHPQNASGDGSIGFDSAASAMNFD
jgi:DNA-binding transcriptional ArsR family regulator